MLVSFVQWFEFLGTNVFKILVITIALAAMMGTLVITS